MTLEIKINPKPKPRMTKRSSYRYTSYWNYKTEINRLVGNYPIDLNGIIGVSFIMPMPKSWSKTKKLEMDGKPHQQKPDLDNLIKAVKDCLLIEDSHVWKYDPPPEKVWGRVGMIVFN